MSDARRVYTGGGLKGGSKASVETRGSATGRRTMGSAVRPAETDGAERAASGALHPWNPKQP